MKKFFIWFGWAILVVLLILYLAFLFVLPPVVNSNIEKYKPDIQKLAKDYTKLDIDFQNAQFLTTPLLATGIKADNISVKLPDGSLLASVDSFKTRISLPHLLIISVKVSCAEINAPYINLEIKDGEQYKVVSLIESLLNAGDDKIEEKLLQADIKTETKAPAPKLPIRISIPAVIIKNYIAKINDLKTGHYLSLKGEELILAYNGKSFKVKTNADFLSDEDKNITANINLDCFIPPASELDNDDDPQEIIDIPFVNPVLLYRDYNLKADVDMDLKIRQRKNAIVSRGYANIDGLTLNLSGIQLPKSYAHIITRGTKVNIDTNLAVKQNESISVQGFVNYGRNKLADLKIKSDKIYFNDVIILTRALLDTLRVKHDLNLFAGKGYIEADTQFRTNFKTLKSAGDILIRNAGIVNEKYNLNFMNFNSTLDLNNNMLQIKDTGATINDSAIEISGLIDEKSIANINLYLEKLPLAPLFNSFAPADIKKVYNINAGHLFADVKFEGALKNAVSTIKFGLKDFSMLERASNMKISNAQFEGNFTSDLKNIYGTLTNSGFKIVIPQTTSVISSDSLKIDVSEKNITINPAVIKINETSALTISGEIANYVKKPIINILTEGKLAADGIKHLCGSMAAPFLDGKGVIPVKITINGDSKKQSLNMFVDADSNNYLTPLHITKLAGQNTTIKSSVDFKQDRIKIKDTGIYIKTQVPDEKNPDKMIVNYKELAGISGTITGLNSVPHINLLKIKLDGDLSGSVQGLDKSAFTANGHLFAYGNLEEPRFKGHFNIKDVNIPTLYTSLKNLALEFNGNKLDAKLEDLNLNGSVLQIDTVLSLIPAANLIVNNLNLLSNYIDADKLLEVSDAAMKLVPQTQTVSQSPAEAADIPVELKNGTINIKRAKSGGITADNITGKLLLKDNVFYLNNLRANAFEGQVLGDVSMNLVTSLMKASVTGSGFDVEKALIGLANMKDTLTGTASFDADVSLQGASYEEQMKTLNGVVDFTLVSGQLGPFGKLENLILAENIRESEFFQTAIGGIINNLLSINTSHYDELTGHILLKDGVANIEPITSLGPIMCINIAGNFDILKNTTDMRIRGRLASTISDMLGPLAMLNPVNMAKTSTGASIMSVATLGLYSLFCETISQEEMDAIPSFSTDASDYNATKFQVIVRGDVAKPLTLVKSFKWLVLQSDVDSANSYIETAAAEEAANTNGKSKTVSSTLNEEKSSVVKGIINNVKGIFKKNSKEVIEETIIKDTETTVETVTDTVTAPTE